LIGVDTNVLVRLFVDDDRRQHQLAVRFFDGRSATDAAFISLVTVVEFFWVMTRTYKRPPKATVELLAGMLESEDAVFEEADEVRQTIAVAQETGADLADLLIARGGAVAGCTTTVTFDQPAAKSVPGMELLK
jgi:predicted nucleic-acid-binding protein